MNFHLVEERGALLAKLLGLNYFIKLMWLIISKLGFQLRDDVPSILARISYSLYFANVFDLFKSQFLHTFFPNLAENKRQSYVVNRSTSVVIWIIGENILPYFSRLTNIPTICSSANCM